MGSEVLIRPLFYSKFHIHSKPIRFLQDVNMDILVPNPNLLLANSNLEDEIHLKGGRFVTSQIFQFGMLYIGHSCISYFTAFCFAILEILSNSRTHGESWGLHVFHI